MMKKVKIGNGRTKMSGFGYKDIYKDCYSYMNSLIEDVNNGKQILMVDKTKVSLDKNKLKPFAKLIEQKKGNVVESNLKKRVDYFVSAKKPVQSYYLTQIEKTVYSKGGGSGAGAYVTKMSECAVCVCLAAKVHCGGYNSSKKYLIPKIDNVCDLGTGNTKKAIEDVMDWLAKNPTWLKSCEKTANAILGSSQINVNASHHFHRDSKFMNSIYDIFKKTIKKDIESSAPGLKVNSNKWNPSDIWISKKSQISASIDSVIGLNNMLIKSFKNSDIIGVSLKKVGTSANFDVYNLPGTKQQTFDFKGLVNQSDPWSAKDVYFLAGDLKIQLRSFDNAQNIQAEIKGKTANNGKCGHGPMQFIFKRNISSFKFKSSDDILAIQKKHGTKKVLEDILEMFKDCFGTSIGDEAFYDNFIKKYKTDKQRDYLVSKYQALQAAVALDTAKPAVQKKIVTGLFGYAYSLGLQNLFEASVYAKVS